MNFTNVKYKANYYVLLLLAFVIPLKRELAPPLIILFFVTSLIHNNFKSKQNKNVLFLTLIYFIYLIGVLYSDNLKAGLFDIEMKLSLLVFPIAFFITNLNLKDKINAVLRSFVDGCIVGILIGLINSFIYFYFTNETFYFFYSNISVFLHAGYFAMYLNFCLLIIYYFFFNKNPLIIKPAKAVTLIIIFSLLIGLLASKTGVLFMLLIHFVAIFYWSIKHQFYIKGIVSILLIIGSLGIAYNYSSIFRGRVDEAIHVIGSGDTSGGSTTAARIDIWKSSLSLIKDQPLIGYGTGDVKDVLVKEYEKRGLIKIAEQKLNTHNQFLQTTLALGLIGGLILLLMLLIPLVKSFNGKYYIYTSFILLIIFNFLTESILERQSGVVFFAFFNTLFFMVLFNSSNFTKREK